MGHKQAKKVRQIYRRDIRDQFIKDGMMLPALLNRVLRPKPFWMPGFVYQWMLRRVLKIEPKIEEKTEDV